MTIQLKNYLTYKQDREFVRFSLIKVNHHNYINTCNYTRWNINHEKKLQQTWNTNLMPKNIHSYFLIIGSSHGAQMDTLIPHIN